jgi:fatty acid desaturase
MAAGRVFSMDEVCERGLVVVGSGVYDLKGFVPRHRGGRFIELLSGTNASHILWNAHAKNPKVMKMLEAYRVGSVDAASLPQVDKDLLELREQFVREGLFEYARAWLVRDFVRLALLFLMALAAVWLNPWLGAVFWTVASIDLVWWIHDAGHDSIFKTEARARRVIEFLGITLLGMPQQGYHYVIHRIHHGFTNVIGVDRALQTGPIVWDVRMRHRTNEVFLALQPLLWFFLVVPLATLALVGGAVAVCVQRRNYLLVAAFVLRWLFVGSWPSWPG